MIPLRIAKRLAWELARDHRTIAFIVVAPLVVMTLIYFALRADTDVKIAVVSRGPARLFDGEFRGVLEADDDVEVTDLKIADEVADDAVLDGLIRDELDGGAVDAVILLGADFLADRFEGESGEIRLYLEGSQPLVSAAALDAVADAMDELAAALPVVIDPECSAECADSVNNKTIDLKRVYMYGADEFSATDYFLPLFPPFFAFFFTFVLAAISFQRERVRGTMDRVFASPAGFLDVVAGYTIGFAGFAALQAAIIMAFVFALIEFPIGPGQVAAVSLGVFLVVIIALLSGLLVSFVAASEFQAVQFIPLVILPQVFLADMIWPLKSFPAVLRYIAQVMPLTYANAYSRDILIRGLPLGQSWPPLLALCGFAAVLLGGIRLARQRFYD